MMENDYGFGAPPIGRPADIVDAPPAAPFRAIMFTIIGGDGKEYGPVPANQLRDWIAAGRANLDTQAKAAGSAEWRRVGDYVEFGAPSLVAPAIPSEGADQAALPLTEPAAASPAASAPLANRGERLLAQILDNVIGLACALPGLILMALAAARAGFGFGTDLDKLTTAAGFSAGLMVTLAALVALAAVQLWMVVTSGQTIGKRVLDLRIVTFEDGTNPGFVKVFLLRAVLPAVLGAIPLIGLPFTLADYGFIFRADRRCLHDLIAGTKVIKV